MDPSGLVVWIGERFLRVGDSLLSRSARRRSFDAEVLEATIRLLNTNTEASLAILHGHYRNPKLKQQIDEVGSALWMDPGLIPDQEAVSRLMKGIAEAVLIAFEEIPRPENAQIVELHQRIIAANHDVIQSAYRRRRELA